MLRARLILKSEFCLTSYCRNNFLYRWIKKVRKQSSKHAFGLFLETLFDYIPVNDIP